MVVSYTILLLYDVVMKGCVGRCSLTGKSILSGFSHGQPNVSECVLRLKVMALDGGR
ncbi:hypothetical protein EXN66_Car017224 [Channa argus]|uniref:Uncharacterized protein n=1 Tax=Channa argus TaxID=215402 RepID=A0A6G1QHF9_CHAAH|nr:hypothetical protein EXN66_Car017224 [Channa argus]